MEKKFFLALACFFQCLCLVAQEKPEVIAHRGHWRSKGSAQNSIASLENAAHLHVYGSEFDVRMTKDSVLVIFHDDAVNDMLIEETPYSVIQDFTLPNGEKIPTLREYLEAAKRFEATRLIFELKTGKRSEPDWCREVARRSVAIVREKRLQLRTEYITFNLNAAKELIRLAPEADVYYLSGDLPPKELKSAGFAGLDYHFDVMRKNPQWFKEAKTLGLGINVWTVNDPVIIREMIDQGADFITTDVPGEVLRIISSVEQ